MKNGFSSEHWALRRLDLIRVVGLHSHGSILRWWVYLQEQSWSICYFPWAMSLKISLMLCSHVALPSKNRRCIKEGCGGSSCPPLDKEHIQTSVGYVCSAFRRLGFEPMSSGLSRLQSEILSGKTKQVKIKRENNKTIEKCHLLLQS